MKSRIKFGTKRNESTLSAAIAGECIWATRWASGHYQKCGRGTISPSAVESRRCCDDAEEINIHRQTTLHWPNNFNALQPVLEPRHTKFAALDGADFLRW